MPVSGLINLHILSDPRKYSESIALLQFLDEINQEKLIKTNIQIFSLYGKEKYNQHVLANFHGPTL